jgi:hypothetical protein
MILGNLLNPRKQVCRNCLEKFHVAHVKSKRHGPISRCQTCGEEFVMESDRYRHIQEEKGKRFS